MQTLPQQLQIVVLTFADHASLNRLLRLLASSNFHDYRIDLRINVDGLNETDSEQARYNHGLVRSYSKKFKWPHGSKQVLIRSGKIGVTESWLQAASPFDIKLYKYIVVFKEDMMVHASFFSALMYADSMGILLDPNVTALCSQLDVMKASSWQTYSQTFYESLTHCSHGAIWKAREWFDYVKFINQSRRSRGGLLINESMPLGVAGWNRIQHLDVESQWTWQYHQEQSKVQIHYTVTS